FDRNTCKIVRAKIDKALKEVGKELGISIDSAGGRFCDSTFNLKIEMKTLNEAGENKSDRDDYELYASSYPCDLDGTEFGKTFNHQGEEFEICGWKPKSRKYPVLGRSKRTGKTFKFNAEMVASLIK
ncbi:MAG: hypothetical protein KAR06_01340, partial [Deltaproteobacteria bacterium]|nr:hypothetical protein [Deltaproteobacteria bacterium]